MATYKVLQDIEAEDKLVGPLTLRQFIYAGISAIAIFLAYRLALVNIFLIAPFLPIIILFGVLAVPFGHEQSNEIWLLARIRFYIKPHRRVWNQIGTINTVTINAPKAPAKTRATKGFTAGEARSRLQTLANTMDSRGWSSKNVNVNLNAQPVTSLSPTASDRLVDPASMPQAVPQDDIVAADDIMDASNNPTAIHLNQMINTSREENKKKMVQTLTNPPAAPAKAKPEKKPENAVPAKPNNWFMKNPTPTPAAPAPSGYTKFGDDQLVSPHSENYSVQPIKETPDEIELLKEFEDNKRKSNLPYSHLHTVKPLDNRPAKPATTKVTPQTNPDIINLALANKNNWSVATIASQAKKAKDKELPSDEVVINLH